MPSEKTKRSASSRAVDKKSQRPILWIGGSGLPDGSAGKKLVRLGNPLHWERISPKAADSVASLQPALVILQSEKLSHPVRKLLSSLSELKSGIDMVVFQLRRREPRRPVTGVDGFLLRGPTLVHQIQVILGTMEGSKVFKAAGRRAQRKLDKAQSEVQRLRNLAVRDDLTCLYNLRFFNRSLETEHQRAMRFGRSYALVFIDLDGLREVNDRRGHLAGGQVLRRVGEFLNNRIRRIDLPARIGGDEFVIICPETAKLAARLVADRLRQGIQSLRDAQGKSLGITASIGVAAFPDDGDLPEDVLQRADRALYEAKSLGKNRICCWGEFTPREGDGRSFLGSVHAAERSTSADSGNSDKEPPVTSSGETVN